ncbi:hypothetical protein SLS62_004964 [Diatrype stigma]|uniref:Uncharacterized protein n=1 Tax=Diatrype stigma TaxID=117547 RepID=A0AAN9UQA9_9PEZI
MAPIDWMIPAHMAHPMYGQYAQHQVHNATTVHDPRGSFIAPTITRGKNMFGALSNAITRSWAQGQYWHQHPGLPLVARGSEPLTPTPTTSPFFFAKERGPSTKPVIILLSILALGVMLYIFFLDVYRKTPILQRIAAGTCHGVSNAFWAVAHPKMIFHRSHHGKHVTAAAAATCAPPQRTQSPRTADSAEMGQAAGFGSSSGTVTPSSNGNGNGNANSNGNGNRNENGKENGKGKEHALPPVVTVPQPAARPMVHGDGGGDDGQCCLAAPQLPPLPSYHSTPAAGSTQNGGEGPSSLH